MSHHHARCKYDGPDDDLCTCVTHTIADLRAENAALRAGVERLRYLLRVAGVALPGEVVVITGEMVDDTPSEDNPYREIKDE